MYYGVEKKKPDPTATAIVVQFCSGCQRQNWLRMSYENSREIRPHWCCAKCKKGKP